MNTFIKQANNAILDEKSQFSNYALAALLGISPLAAKSVDASPQNQITRTVENSRFSLEEQKNIITRTIWAEAKGEGERGMRAVASVIYNRGRGQVSNYVPVAIRRWQFSCWNGTTPEFWDNFQIRIRSGTAWDIATKITEEMFDGTFTPITDANHYYNPSLASPSWSRTSSGEPRPFTMIGNHKFLKL